MTRIWLKGPLLFLLLISGSAQTLAHASPPSALSDYVLKDKFSVQLVSGALFSPVIKSASRPDFHYIQTNIRLIWGLDPYLTARKLDWNGYFDAILELTHSWVFVGAGNVIGGVTGLLRYNLPSHRERWFPYIQAGVGVVYTNAYKDLSQNLIGQAVEFNPQFSLGLHYLIDKNWAVDGEAMFHHISNAGMSDGRNVGVNAVGGFIGVTRYFDGP